MKNKKVVVLIIALVLIIPLLAGCSSKTLGYRKYPSVHINPSVMGDMIKIRLPLDENRYVYHSYDCANTEEGIDLTIHFLKSD